MDEHHDVDRASEHGAGRTCLGVGISILSKVAAQGKPNITRSFVTELWWFHSLLDRKES